MEKPGNWECKNKIFEDLDEAKRWADIIHKNTGIFVAIVRTNKKATHKITLDDN